MHMLRMFYDHELTERYKLQNEEKLLLSFSFLYTKDKINVNRKTGLRIYCAGLFAEKEVKFWIREYWEKIWICIKFTVLMRKFQLKRQQVR